MPLVVSKLIWGWLQACGFESGRALPAYTPCPAARFFPPAWRPKYRANRGPNRRTARPARQGRSRTQAAGAKCYPFSPCRRTIRSDICSNRPQSARAFRRRRDDFAFIGFVHKDSDILHRGQSFPAGGFLKHRLRKVLRIVPDFGVSKCNQTQNRRLATAARPEQSFHFAMLQVQTEIRTWGLENFKTHVFKTASPSPRHKKISKGLVIAGIQTVTQTR